MAAELHIEPIPAFDDNYIWLLWREGRAGCAVVDPGDDEPVREALAKRGLRLENILITHKHGDHVGGIAALKAVWPKAVVHGPAGEPIRALERRLRGGERLVLEGPDLVLEVLDVPGHTEGHIAYLGDDILFCGDTLFACGCGRVFSGTFEQLADSLRMLALLPPVTRICCAHEYTLDNIGFAKWVEPDNPDLSVREQRVREQRARGEPGVPSTLAEELATNPFLRTGESTVITAAECWAGRMLDDPTAVFTALRTWKDKDYD